LSATYIPCPLLKEGKRLLNPFLDLPYKPKGPSSQALPCTTVLTDPAPGPGRPLERADLLFISSDMGRTRATNILIKRNPFGKIRDLVALPCQQPETCKQDIALVPAVGRDLPGNILSLPALCSHCTGISFHIM